VQCVFMDCVVCRIQILGVNMSNERVSRPTFI